MIEFNNIILERILDLAALMLMSGGEVRRVEDTITFLCRAYGAKYADVFTITSSIVVTVRFEDKEPLTQTRRISNQVTNMSHLARLNELSRSICKKPITAQEFTQRLEETKRNAPSKILTILSWGMISGSFSLFFGGIYLDAVISFFVGILVCLVKNLFSKRIGNNYLLIIFLSVLGGILGFLPTLFIESVSPFYINIGNIMLLIPGIALTTSIRDMFSGDTISGLLRFAEAILISLVIAWGFANFGAGQIITDANPFPFIQLITSFTGTFGFAFIFNSRPRNCFIAAMGGFVGWAIVLIGIDLGLNEYMSFLVSTIFITLFSEIFARVLKCPATVFLVTGLIPLIPGKALYSTMCYLMKENWLAFLKQGVSTIMYAISISAGIVIITALFSKKRHQ